MGFTVTDSDGNVKSKIVFWGNIPVDVMTITSVEELDNDGAIVVVMTEKTGDDGVTEMAGNVIDMGSHAQASKVHKLALGYLKANKERG